MSLGLTEIYELSQDVSEEDLFIVLEANDVDPEDIEELLGKRFRRQYEQHLNGESNEQ